MMQSKQDLELFLSEDWKRNMHTELPFSYMRLVMGRIRHSDHAYAVHFLRALRKYEYSLSRPYSAWSKIVCNWYKWRYAVLSTRYNIHIVPNTVGYGLYLPHVVGGG